MGRCGHSPMLGECALIVNTLIVTFRGWSSTSMSRTHLVSQSMVYGANGQSKAGVG